MTSPEIPAPSSAPRARRTTSSMWSASLRQGITTETSGVSTGSGCSSSTGVPWEVLMRVRRPGREGSPTVITRQRTAGRAGAPSYSSPLRILIVYDCLYPYTVGGAERWYRRLAERLARDGHDVTLATRLQWDREAPPEIPGVRVIAVTPRTGLYTASGRRRIDEAVLFGLGVLWHLLRHRRSYDVVHTASFPYFSLLAAGFVRPLAGYRLIVDWHELWSFGYWREYLGPAGVLGWLIQEACLRIPQRAFCFARLTALRLTRVRGPVQLLQGQWEGSLKSELTQPPAGSVVFAGRLIREKHADAVPAAVTWARRDVPGLRCDIYGDGPAREAVTRAAAAMNGLRMHGFVSDEEFDAALASALCLVLPSRREGYGKVVIEAARLGTPSIVVLGEDNAAIELVEEGINGAIAPSIEPEDLGAAILRVHEGGAELRESTARWFEEHAHRLSLETSLQTVVEAYGA